MTPTWGKRVFLGDLSPKTARREIRIPTYDDKSFLSPQLMVASGTLAGKVHSLQFPFFKPALQFYGRDPDRSPKLLDGQVLLLDQFIDFCSPQVQRFAYLGDRPELRWENDLVVVFQHMSSFLFRGSDQSHSSPCGESCAF
jgi:hypothetical protein